MGWPTLYLNHLGITKKWSPRGSSRKFVYPRALSIQFKIVDYMGDGTCCWAGNGLYNLYEGEDIEDEDFLIFHGNGDFGQQKVHTFTAG